MAQKRMFLFQISEADQQPNKLVAYAAKLPQRAKTGDSYQDEDRGMKREAFQRIVDKLWRNHDIVMQTSSWVEKKVAELSQRGSGDTSKTISNIKAIDDTWLCAFFGTHFVLSRDKLERACNVDPDVMVQMLQYGMVAGPSVKLPSECKVKFVLENTLLARFKDSGDRLAGLSAKSDMLNQDGSFNWLNHGVYYPTFGTDGIATKITDRPTGHHAKLPEHVRVSRSFALENNWSDFGATLTLKPVVYTVADLFEDEKGPHTAKLLTAKDLDALAKKAAGDIRRPVTTTQAKKFRADQKTQARRRNMANARKTLKTTAAQLKAKRRVTFEA